MYNTFSAIQRTNCCNTTGQDIGVYLDSTLVGTFHPSNTAYVEYSTAPFSTTTGAHVVKFAGLNINGDQTAFIDKVRISGNPKPGFGVQWIVADQLGTPRMVFDESGSLTNVKRHDYLPFGEELFAQTGGRSQAEGYANDGVRQQFTGQERDAETGLDYFLARYYSAPQGRFASADPLAASAQASNPQTWNRYSYGMNNPLKHTDPTGMTSVPSYDSMSQSEIEKRKWFHLEKQGERTAEEAEPPSAGNTKTDSGEDATTTDTPAIRWDSVELLSGDADEVLKSAPFKGVLLNEATLNVDHSRVGNVDEGAAFVIRVRFNLPKYAEPDSIKQKSFVKLGPDNRWQSYKPATGAKAIEFSADGRAASVVIRLQQRDAEGKNNNLIISVSGNYGNGDPFGGQATVHIVTKAYSPPQQPIFKKP